MSESPLDSPIAGRRMLREAVYQRLRSAIIDGHLRPGERLVEIRLAARLNVSRNPVREALRRLEQEQLVCASSQGMIVSEITATKVQEAYAIRSVLEGFCCRLAAEQATPQEVDELRQTVERARRAVEAGDIAAVTQCSEQFHDLLLQASRNVTLRSVLGQVRDSVLRYRYATIPLAGRAREMVAEHAIIVEAIAAGDGARAEQAAREHILEAGRRLVASL